MELQIGLSAAPRRGATRARRRAGQSSPALCAGLGANPDLRPRRRPLQGRAIEVIATYSGGLSQPQFPDLERPRAKRKPGLPGAPPPRISDPRREATDNRQPANRYPIAARNSGSADASSSACADATSSNSRASTASTDVPSRCASSRNTSR